MNAHHYENKDDEKVKKFLEERTQFLHTKMSKLASSNQNLIN